MKKAKAKPVKGSARTKKFDAGGLAALAGLGTLAYLMSRKKKGDDEGGKFEDLKSVGKTKTLEEQIGRGAKDQIASAEIKRAMAASQGRPELIPEGADEAVMRSDTGIKRVMPTPTPKPKRTTSGGGGGGGDTRPIRLPTQDFSTPESSQAFPVARDAGKANVDLPSKPYPKDVKPKDKSISTSGIGPKLTYGTPSQLDAAKAAMRRYREEEKKKQRGVTDIEYDTMGNPIMKRGGKVKKYASGGSVSSASKRADGIAQKGKTRGRIV